jgi:hypothetical protein
MENQTRGDILLQCKRDQKTKKIKNKKKWGLINLSSMVWEGSSLIWIYIFVLLSGGKNWTSCSVAGQLVMLIASHSRPLYYGKLT